MSISHPPQPSSGGDAGCGQASVSPDWVWLSQRFEENVAEGFGAWIDDHLLKMEAELCEFASSQATDRRSRA